MLQFILFANDTAILFSDKDISSKVDLINTEVKEVTNWFKTNKLSVNASKTNFMIVGTTHQTSKPENNIKVRERFKQAFSTSENSHTLNFRHVAHVFIRRNPMLYVLV